MLNTRSHRPNASTAASVACAALFFAGAISAAHASPVGRSVLKPAGEMVGHKKIIWFGPMKGPTDLTAQDIQNCGQAFDGFVVQNVRGSQDKPGESFQNEAFTLNHAYTITPTETHGDYIGRSLTALERLPSNPAPYRFLRINSCPYNNAGFNWLDDGFWAIVKHNMRIAGQVCQEGGLTGIFLDTEQYRLRGGENEYNYLDLSKDPRYAGVSYDQLSAIAEKRGRELIKVINAGIPNATILISFGYSTISPGGRAEAEAHGSILGAFLDGMLDGSTPTTTFVDAFENGYWHNNDPDYFQTARGMVLSHDQATYQFQKYPEKYARQYQFGAGLFLDRDTDLSGQHNVYGWCGQAHKEVFYSPGRLAFTVQQAAKAADEWVWVYSWHGDATASPGTTGAIPPAYLHAIQEGMRHANDPSLAPLPANFNTAPESESCP